MTKCILNQKIELKFGNKLIEIIKNINLIDFRIYEVFSFFVTKGTKELV